MPGGPGLSPLTARRKGPRFRLRPAGAVLRPNLGSLPLLCGFSRAACLVPSSPRGATIVSPTGPVSARVRVTIACVGALRNLRDWTVSSDFLVKATIGDVVLIGAQSLKNHVPLLGRKTRCRGRNARLHCSGAMFRNRLCRPRLTGNHLNSKFPVGHKDAEIIQRTCGVECIDTSYGSVQRPMTLRQTSREGLWSTGRAVEPCQRPLDNPALPAQPFAAVYASPGDAA